MFNAKNEKTAIHNLFAKNDVLKKFLNFTSLDDFEDHVFFDTVFENFVEENAPYHSVELKKWVSQDPESLYFMERVINDDSVSTDPYNVGAHIREALQLQMTEQLEEYQESIVRYFACVHIMKQKLEITDKVWKQFCSEIEDFDAWEDVVEFFDDIKESK